MELIVVRHAHAGSRRNWAGSDAERPLSPKGFLQAEGIAAALASSSPAMLLSSPRVRCVQTLAPLAERVGATVATDHRLDEGPDVDDLLDLVDEVAVVGEVVVLCSHGDVIPELLWALAQVRGVTLPERTVWQKASTWTIDLQAGTAAYTPPPTVGASID